MKHEVYYRARLQQLDPRRPSYDEYIKIKDTPKGVVVVPEWVFNYYDKDSSIFKEKSKRVLNDTINKWCYPTKEEALFALTKRCEKRRRILKAQLNAVNEFLELGVDNSKPVFAVNDLDLLLRGLKEYKEDNE